MQEAVCETAESEQGKLKLRFSVETSVSLPDALNMQNRERMVSEISKLKQTVESLTLQNASLEKRMTEKERYYQVLSSILEHFRQRWRIAGIAGKQGNTDLAAQERFGIKEKRA